ncbi:cell wall hydrolase [Sphingomonas sp. ASV193]|uniref:cell wall hydrolase n=1 Tax=Sphingomonas sp. ASV193 TaxID=3144405 RepID=UPI0032E87079
MAFALSASSVAPAQVGPGSEPLLAAASAQIPETIRPALLPAVATPETPEHDSLSTADPSTVETVAPGLSFESEVAELRSASAGSAELECLAGAIYFESKSEPLKGQLAVGHVLANRTKSGRFPSSYCGVVYQRGQFSFVRGHAMPHIDRSGRQWQNAVAIAKIVDRGLQPSPLSGKALFFHAKRVSPSWHAVRVGSIGNHIFYR